MDRKAAELSALKMSLYLAITDTSRNRPAITNAIYLQRVRSHRVQLSTDPNKIECGRNSGFGAVNLAVHFNAKQIYLFGFDYQPNSYYCPQRYAHKKPESGSHWPTWAKFYDCIKEQLISAGVSVINASPNSSITAFPKVSIDKALGDLSRLRRP